MLFAILCFQTVEVEKSFDDYTEEEIQEIAYFMLEL
jgi:hypothetical protein